MIESRVRTNDKHKQGNGWLTPTHHAVPKPGTPEMLHMQLE